MTFNVPDKESHFFIIKIYKPILSNAFLFTTIWSLVDRELQKIFIEMSHICGEIERLKTSILISRWVFAVPHLDTEGNNNWRLLFKGCLSSVLLSSRQESVLPALLVSNYLTISLYIIPILNIQKFTSTFSLQFSFCAWFFL